MSEPIKDFILFRLATDICISDKMSFFASRWILTKFFEFSSSGATFSKFSDLQTSCRSKHINNHRKFIDPSHFYKIIIIQLIFPQIKLHVKLFERYYAILFVVKVTFNPFCLILLELIQKLAHSSHQQRFVHKCASSCSFQFLNHTSINFLIIIFSIQKNIVHSKLILV